jgi:2-polyprenyl-3-methyl-5-hydroxy-6-metoxy-1,4-benzoquinol methylase
MENEIQKTLMQCPVCGTGVPVLYMRKNNCTLYACTACKFWFVHPVPSVADVYTQEYFTGAHGGFGYVNYDRDKKPMASTFEQYVQCIEKYAPDHGRLLDIGAATGFFLSIVKHFGFDPYGVEISDYAAAQAREKGFPVITGVLADVPLTPRFSVITILDVIEHVMDPRAEIMRVRELLCEGGIFVINTQDTGSKYARLMGRKWHLIVPPEHLYYFNRKNMRLLLAQCGFEVLEITTIGKRFSLPYIFATLHAWQKIPLWRTLARLCEHGWLSRMYIPINLGDNMLILARKLP